MSERCAHGERCSGCTMLGVPYGEQLARKRLRVINDLARYPTLGGVEVRPAAGADPVVGYRTRVKWVVGPAGELGLFAREGDHVTVDIPGCLVAAPALARAGQALRAMLARPGWLRRSLRAVDLREVRRAGQARVLATLVIDDPGGALPLDEARAAARALMAADGEVLGVALNLAPPRSPQILGPRTLPLAGATEADDEVQGGASVKATFGSFVQAHRGQAGAIIEALAAAAGEGPVLELYGGSGATGLALARRGLAVDSVEAFGPASAAAARAASEQGLLLRALRGDAGEAASALSAEGRRYELVLVNPPRRGLSPGLREALGSLRAGRIAYVSCEPRTLARDLDHLARLGYAASEARPHDMIPLTDEVETLVLLDPRPAPPPRLLLDAGTGLFFEKAAHEALVSGSPSLLDRVRRLPGLEQAVAVSKLDAGSSGVCLFARTADAAGAWAEALAAGRQMYLVGARGVTSPRGSINRPLHERGRAVAARTRYTRRAVWHGHSLLEAWPEQGRTHQIERHLSGLGHPVLGDERHGHGPTNRHFFEKYGLDRPFVHCSRIELIPPGASEPLGVDCPPAPDLPLPDAKVAT